MSYWIYNMGLAVPVSTQKLIDRREVKATSATARTDHLDERHHADSSDVKSIGEYTQLQPKAEKQPIYQADQIMSRQIKTLSIDMNFKQAWRHFKQHGFRHFPVLDKNQRLAGIVSDRNMLSHIAATRNSKATLLEIMSHPVLTADSQTLIREVCQVMYTQHIGALPITNGENNLVGMITRSDILHSMIHHGPVELWA